MPAHEPPSVTAPPPKADLRDASPVQPSRVAADAPTDDLDWQPQRVAATQVLEADRAVDAAGYDMVRTLALAPDGPAAGMRELMVSRLRPSLARQASISPATNCPSAMPASSAGPSVTSSS